MKESLYQATKTAYRQYLEQTQKELQEGYASAKTDVLQAEGRMVTRYDSMKTEMAWVANGLLAELMKAEAALQRLAASQLVHIHDCVKVLTQKSDGAVNSEWVYIGWEQPRDESIRQLRPDSEEALSLLGQTVGQTVAVEQTMEGGTMQIVEVKSDAGADLVVDVDTLIALQESDQEEEWYYVTTDQGGIFLDLPDGKEVVVISVKAPLTQVLLGKSVGTRVTFSQEKLRRELVIRQVLRA